MPKPDFLALYRCKTPYNYEETLLDTIAWVRQEHLEPIAKEFCKKIADHDRLTDLEGEQIIQFDEYLRPLLMASNKQRKLMMLKGITSNKK
ncbi:hypothetical protein [Roseibium sp.]|uniref:hypothetical protein n=1 Tax=Roseibium sp. TaxID=1936156 RepID=UPI003B52F782